MDSSRLPLSCSKRSVLNNGQLEFIFSNYFERSVLNNGQFEFTFVMFQAVSPKQWTAWVYFYHVFKWSVLNNGQLEFTLVFQKEYQFPALSEHGILSFIPRLAGLRKFTQIQFSQVSSPVCLDQRCHQSNVCFYKPSVYKYISKFPNVHSWFCFPVIHLHTTINTVVDNHFPQWNYSIPGRVGSLSSTNLGIPFHSKQIIFIILHS